MADIGRGAVYNEAWSGMGKLGDWVTNTLKSPPNATPAQEQAHYQKIGHGAVRGKGRRV